LFWGDERYVSHKSKNSNYKLAYDTFIKKIKINKKNLFTINTNIKNFLKSSKSYSDLIKKYFKKKKISFDYFLLGMGDDGHIASIFPDSAELSKKFIVRPVYRNDFKRITLSLNVINNSKKIVLWLNSKYKSKKFLKLRKKGKKIPINKLNNKKTIVYKIS
jgi:6-phosphogluconolactonase